MKTHYEVLGVAPHVGLGQIQAAYRFSRALYSGESAATYGLLDAEERAEMLARVETAFAVLADPNARRDYDISLNAGEVLRAPRGSVSEATRPPAVRPRSAVVPAPSPTSLAPTVVAPPAETAEVALPPLSVPEVVTGRTLTQLREARQMTLDQISALSKVGSRFLKALEQDQHEVLPGRVFARGFLIEYARALRVPEGELVDRYLRQWRGR